MVKTRKVSKPVSACATRTLLCALWGNYEEDNTVVFVYDDDMDGEPAKAHAERDAARGVELWAHARRRKGGDDYDDPTPMVQLVLDETEAAYRKAHLPPAHTVLHEAEAAAWNGKMQRTVARQAAVKLMPSGSRTGACYQSDLRLLAGIIEAVWTHMNYVGRLYTMDVPVRE